MAREIERLTALRVEKMTRPGLHPDGQGLYLQLSETGTKSWSFLYTLCGRSRQAGLGPFPDVSLAEARELARAARAQCRAGIDPIDHRRALLSQRALEGANRITFQQMVERFVAVHGRQWSEGYRADFEASMKRHAYPALARVNMTDINQALALKVLRPLWERRPATAANLRAACERVGSFAKASGFCSGDNAFGRDLLQLLGSRPKAVNRAALPYQEMPAFMRKLRAQEGVVARCLEFVALTACRSTEAIHLKWDEVDLAAQVATIEAARFKSRRDFKILLSPRAMRILEAQHEKRTGPFVFASTFAISKSRAAEHRPISEDMLRIFLRTKLGETKATVHGLRSSFKTFSSEMTNYDDAISELCLGHRLPGALRQIYDRSEMLARRRRLLAEWAAFCGGEPVEEIDNVTPLRRA